jgi:sugar (pentulose or hexulose) kinase
MGVLRPGDLLLSCGTSWAGLLVSPDRERFIRAGLLIDPFLPEERLWACIFAMTRYGEKIDAAVGRFIDSSDNKFRTLNALARKGLDDGKYTLCSLEDERACAEKWEGLSGEEIAYSIMKSSCADAARRIKDLEKTGVVPGRIFMAGGLAASALWPQILADTLGREVYCLHRQYGGAVGASIMAAIGDGRFRDEKDFYRDKKSVYQVYAPDRKGLYDDERI